MRLQTKHYRAALGHTFERMESRVQVKYRLHMESLESRRVLASSVGFISAPLVLQDDLGGNVVAIGDIDGDGKNDIVGTRFPVRADESPLYLIRDEMGHGVFGGKKESIDSNMGDITDLKLVDLDVDGDLDVFAYRRCVFSGCSFGALYENVDGAGRFEERPIPVSIENGWIEVADIDADGDPDIVATSTDCLFTCTFSDLSWYENTGRFTSFVKHPIQIMTGWSDRFSFMSVSDFDRDGDADLLLSRDFQEDFETITIVEWFENRDGQFLSPREVAIGFGFGFDIDVDGDGYRDIMTMNADERQMYLSRYDVESREFQVPVPVIMMESEVSVQFLAADIDHDGDEDFFVTGALGQGMEPLWYENMDGHGIEWSEHRIAIGQEVSFLVPVDLDYDGDLDLVSNHYAGYECSIDGAMCAPLSDAVGLYWYENRPIGDANNDGVFNSSDLVKIFQTGEYEDGVQGNSTFEEGDWNGDGEFDSSDLVAAFQSGNFVAAAVEWQHIAARLNVPYSNEISRMDGRRR